MTVLADGGGGAVVGRVTAVPANAAAGPDAVVLKWGPPVELAVRAVAEGKPVAGALVTLVYGDPGLDRAFSWGYNDVRREYMVRGRTGADGVALFPALQTEEATVLVQAQGYARHRVGWRNGAREVTAELGRRRWWPARPATPPGGR